MAWAEPNYLSQVKRQTSDPLFSSQWTLNNLGLNGAVTNADVQAPEAWAKAVGSPGIVIAVLDDGVQLDHPDLSAAIFSNPGESLNGQDDDGNGYVDDLHGWDFYRDDNDPSPEFPGDKHGTATAGVAAATPNKKIGVAGIAYNSRILPGKVLGGENWASDSALAEAIYYAAGRTRDGSNTWRGADVISIGLAFPQSVVVDIALLWASTNGRGGKGCLIFAAAGADASRWLPTRLRVAVGDLLGPGLYRFGFEYSKDVDSSVGEDLIKIDNVALLGGDGVTQLDSLLGPAGRQDFEGAFPPAGWQLVTSAGAAVWTATTNRALTGTKGSISAQSGPIQDKQWTEMRTPVLTLSGSETLSFSCYLSSETDFDGLRIWVYDANDNYVTVFEGPLSVPLLSGNLTLSSSISYPARHSQVMAVGASTDADVRADYSQSGTGLGFLAPSSGGWNDVITTDRTGADGYATGDYAFNFGGASAACPLAAGIGALVLSSNPELTASQTRTLLHHSCDKIGSLVYDASGWNSSYGYGRLNAERAATTAKATAGPYEVIIIAPTNHAIIADPEDIIISVLITNLGGAITKVAFFAEDAPIGEVTNAPYAMVWTNLIYGAHVLTAQATDDLGRTRFSPRVTVEIVPSVSIACVPEKTVEYGANWDFDVPTVLSSCGIGHLTVLTTATNNAGFCGNTFAVTRTWQATDDCHTLGTCSQVVSVVDTTPPVVNCPIAKGVICGTAWSFDDPTGLDLASGTNVTVTIAQTVTNGACGQTFSAIRTWNVTDPCGNVAICRQTVTNSTVLIEGMVYYAATYPPAGPFDKPLAGVTVSLTGSENRSTQTAADGSYRFIVNAGCSFTVRPEPVNSNATANAVTTVDLSLTRRQILQVSALGSPYRLLAADVNGSRSVSTLDLFWMQKLILGTTNIFPAGLWRFVPSDYVFPDPVTPWDAPPSRTYTNLMGDAHGQDFVAIGLGDVNQSWTPPAAAAPLSATGIQPPEHQGKK